MKQQEFEKLIGYLKKNKPNLEISRFDGDIFWYNHLVTFKVLFPCLYAYFESDLKSYWLILEFGKTAKMLGEKFYRTYKNKPDLFKKKFYSYRKYFFQCFQKLIKTPCIDKRLYQKYAGAAQKIMAFTLGPLEVLEKVLDQEISLKVKNKKEQEILKFPLYTSYVQKRDKELMDIIRSLSKKEIANYRKKWGWTFINYASPRIPSLKEIFGKAKELSRKKEKELKILKEIKKKKKLKLALLKKSSPEIKKLICFLDIVFELRDQRKAFWLQTMIPFKNWLTKVGKKHSLFYEEIRWLIWKEQCDLDKKDRKKFIVIIKERKKNCVTLFCYKKPGRNFIFTGEQASKIKSLIFETRKKEKLSGIPANSGRVTGKIKNIESAKDFKIFKEKEILVVSHTTPDYVPLMKKAKAILTERGGITCHAAIVSRELGKPCIVGIKGLVGNFNDGDLVEVDANKGVVKILKHLNRQNE